MFEARQVKLQTKFGIGIIIVFAILAASIAAVSFIWVDQNTILAAQQRVQLYIQASWEIYNGKLDRMESALDILARDEQIDAFLKDSKSEQRAAAVRAYLESVRLSQSMDVLNLLDADGKVLLRTRPPYNHDDLVNDDPVVRRAVTTRKTSRGTVILQKDRLAHAGDGLLEQCLQYGDEPRGMMLTAAVPIIENDRIVGILQIGNLMNGAGIVPSAIADAPIR